MSLQITYSRTLILLTCARQSNWYPYDMHAYWHFKYHCCVLFSSVLLLLSCCLFAWSTFVIVNKTLKDKGYLCAAQLPEAISVLNQIRIEIVSKLRYLFHSSLSVRSIVNSSTTVECWQISVSVSTSERIFLWVLIAGYVVLSAFFIYYSIYILRIYMDEREILMFYYVLLQPIWVNFHQLNDFRVIQYIRRYYMPIDLHSFSICDMYIHQLNRFNETISTSHSNYNKSPAPLVKS